MAVDTKIQDESEYNEIVETTKKAHAIIEKWAAENGVNLSPKFIEKKRNSIMSLVAIWNYGIIRKKRFISL